MLKQVQCGNFEDLAVLYAAGELSVAERAVVDAHVRECPGCAAILSRELELREQQLNDELHYRTLERIFIEERIYKLIEKCKTNESVIAAVYDGFKPFKRQLIRDIVDADVEKLLGQP